MPFFSGIFLEDKLETSSRMFEFIYKMFGEGFATLPKDGIEAIPKQLKKKLNDTNFLFNTKVISLKDGLITLNNGETLKTDATIIATEAKRILPNIKIEKTNWKSCDTLYFEVEKSSIKKPFIGLIPNKYILINNIFFHTNLKTKHKGKKELLSVSIVKNHDLINEKLVKKVKEELKQYCGIDSCKFIEIYKIPKALPDLKKLKKEKTIQDITVDKNVFLAGDTNLNASLNGAMLAGEIAGRAVINSFTSN